MGLIPDDESDRKTRALPALSLPGIVIAVSGLLALLGEPGRSWLRYDRSGIADWELWRLVSGHFVHLGFTHFVLNALGLLLIFSLFYARFSPRQWLAIMIVSIAGIDLGFGLLEPDLSWYVGLSGILHGLLAAGTVAACKRGQWEGWLLLALLLGKLGYEQSLGPLPGSVQSTGGPVVVAAHLYGAIAGALAGLALLFRQRQKAPI